MRLFIIKMLKNPKYLGLAISLSLLILFLFAFIQVLPQGINNFWFWFSILSFWEWFFYLSYGILFGLTLSFFFWRRNKKICLINKSAKKGSFGFAGGFLGISVPFCAGCLPLLALLLPVSLAFSLAKYSVAITALSVLMLFLALWSLSAFKKYG